MRNNQTGAPVVHLNLWERFLGFLMFDLPKLGAALLCAAPILLIVVGLYRLLFTDLRLTFGAILAFFLLPGGILFFLIRMLQKELSCLSKFLRALGLWALMLLFWLYATAAFDAMQFHTVIRQDAAARFTGDYDWVPAFHKLDLGEPIREEYHKCEDRHFLDTSEVGILLCQYEALDYPRQKAALETSFRFLSEPLLGDYYYAARHGGVYESFDPTVVLGDYVFRFAERGFDYWEPYYKQCCIVVTNDSTGEIGYLFYDNIDVDSVSDIHKFIEKNCCWNFVR
ncbi:MAG: hypothetical protein II062_06295 [Oscillospiraceae bacterium]|nr:hypothetical protein [Oscillospiraceae bacterium]